MKLKCNTVQRFISDYIDGALSSSDTAKVEKHLMSCQMCRKEVIAFKKTRDLVVDFYVEPEVSESYYHQFEVELHRCIESKGPTSLTERLQSSAGQFTWTLLTQLRQSCGRYGFINRHVASISVILLIIITGFAAMKLMENYVSSSDQANLQNIGKPVIATELASVDEQSESIHGMHNDYIMQRKSSGEVPSSTTLENSEEVGYWKLAEPISTESEGHIIVLQVSEDRSVPSDTTNSELIVYAQPDILSRKSPLQNDEYGMASLGHPVELFLAKYQRKHRQTPRFVNKLMYEHSKIPTIPELYDLSKF